MSATKYTLAQMQATLGLAGVPHELDGDRLLTQCVACANRGVTSRLVLTAHDGECDHGCDLDTAIAAILERVPPTNGHAGPADGPQYRVEWLVAHRRTCPGPRADGTCCGGARKLQLPAAPDVEQPEQLRAWLNCAFNLHPSHPIIDGERQGQAGTTGHIELRRRNAPPIRFEPATRITSPAKLAETLNACKTHLDGETYGFTGEHTRTVELVVRRLCGTQTAVSANDETQAIIDSFLDSATCVHEHTIHGTSGQRYEALAALKRDRAGGMPIEAPKYLLDATTGECVVRAGDLARAARDHVGSIPHGWLDGRMQALGWKRVTVQGYALPGREGRRGPHLRHEVYRGRLPGEHADLTVATSENTRQQATVNT